MKKGVLLLFILLSLFSVPVLAEDSAGVLPGSTWYSFDRFFEKMHLIITFDHAKKAKLHLDYAGERSAEASAEAENNNLESARNLLNDYNYEITEAKKELKSVEEGEEKAVLSSELESLTSENKPMLQTIFIKSEKEERLRPEIRNYPYNITDAEEEKLKQKEKIEEELEEKLQEMEEMLKDEGGA